MALCRCPRPTNDTSITVCSTHHEENCNAYQPALPTLGTVRGLPLCSVSARLSGDPPDSRSGGAVRLNPSRRARCEGARESRCSHAASLNEGLGRVHVQKAAFLVFGFLPRALFVTLQGEACERSSTTSVVLALQVVLARSASS